MKRHEETAGWRRICRALLLGMLAAAAAGAVFLLVTALVMTLTDIPQAAVTAAAVAAAAFAALIGGMLAARLFGARGWLLGGICGLLLFIPILITGLLLHHGVRIGFLLMKLAALLFCGMAGGVIGVNRR